MAYNPTIGSIYHLYIYILPSGGLYATYHPLGEPETTIEWIGEYTVRPMDPSWGMQYGYPDCTSRLKSIVVRDGGRHKAGPKPRYK